MRKDITVEKLMLGGEKLNKSELARRYNCCWEIIDRRLNPEKYKKEKKMTEELNKKSELLDLTKTKEVLPEYVHEHIKENLPSTY